MSSALCHNGQCKNGLSLKSSFSLVLLVELIATQKVIFDWGFRSGQMCFTVTFTKIISPSKWRMGVCVSGQKITTEFLRALVSRKGMLFQLVAAGLKFTPETLRWTATLSFLSTRRQFRSNGREGSLGDNDFHLIMSSEDFLIHKALSYQKRTQLFGFHKLSKLGMLSVEIEMVVGFY